MIFEVRTVSSTPSPSRASDTSRHSSALTSDRRSPPINNSEAITASSRPRRCAVVWDSTPRPSVRGRAAVARIAASPSARSGAACPGPGRRPCDGSRPTRGRSLPGGVGLAGELGPKPDGGDGEGGGGGRAARLEDRAEVDGQRGGRSMPAGTGDRGVHLCEGPLDALALMHLARLGAVELAGAVVGAQGTPGFTARACAGQGPVELWPDPDAAGSGAALRLRLALEAAGRRCSGMRQGATVW